MKTFIFLAALVPVLAYAAEYDRFALSCLLEGNYETISGWRGPLGGSLKGEGNFVYISNGCTSGTSVVSTCPVVRWPESFFSVSISQALLFRIHRRNVAVPLVSGDAMARLSELLVSLGLEKLFPGAAAQLHRTQAREARWQLVDSYERRYDLTELVQSQGLAIPVSADYRAQAQIHFPPGHYDGLSIHLITECH